MNSSENFPDVSHGPETDFVHIFFVDFVHEIRQFERETFSNQIVIVQNEIHFILSDIQAIDFDVFVGRKRILENFDTFFDDFGQRFPADRFDVVLTPEKEKLFVYINFLHDPRNENANVVRIRIQRDDHALQQRFLSQVELVADENVPVQHRVVQRPIRRQTLALIERDRSEKIRKIRVRIEQIIIILVRIAHQLRKCLRHARLSQTCWTYQNHRNVAYRTGI